MENKVIEFRNVTKRFGDVAAVVENNLAVRTGEFLSILGPSGCGKTTSLRMMAGFEQPSEGNVFISGKDMTGVPAYRRMRIPFLKLYRSASTPTRVGTGLGKHNESQSCQKRRERRRPVH